MFVIVDIEWAIKDRVKYPTQIAAARVDKDWEIKDEFSSIIRFDDETGFMTSPASFTGFEFEEFKSAPELKDVLCSFLEWLMNYDTICWWDSNSNIAFKKALKRELNKSFGYLTANLNIYVSSFLNVAPVSKLDPYEIAKDRSIDVPEIRNKASNDVIAIINLLKGIGCEQRLISKSLVLGIVKNNKLPTKLYFFDLTGRRYHDIDCPLIADSNGEVGYGSALKAQRRSLRPCECVKEEHRKLIREHIDLITERSGFNYIFYKNSKVFHKPDCPRIISSSNILGTKYYSSLIKRGLRPCKVCKPVILEDQIKNTNVRKPSRGFIRPRYSEAQEGQNRKKTFFMSLDEKHAIGRLKQAQSERIAAESNNTLSEQERLDLMALSQPGLAFFASRGYKFFHLRNCPVLAGLTNIVGFNKFDKAIKGGYKPCRHCNPSKRYDANISIPITNQNRAGERITDIYDLVEKSGFTGYRYTNVLEKVDAYVIETPVGKWMIHLQKCPIIVDHINYVKTPGNTNYHRQHRMFLSFVDTFEYIKRHDESLISGNTVETEN